MLKKVCFNHVEITYAYKMYNALCVSVGPRLCTMPCVSLLDGVCGERPVFLTSDLHLFQHVNLLKEHYVNSNAISTT